MDSNHPAYIYVLIDPRSSETRYVGKTEHPEKRLKEHIRFVRDGRDRSYKAGWLKQLLSLDLLPVFTIVKDSSAAEWVEDERAIIWSLRANGARLTNLARGGEGGDPTPMRQGFRAKYRNGCIRGHPWTPQNIVLVKHADGSTTRTCRTCKRERNNARYRESHPPCPEKSACPNGHPRTIENTVIYKDASRSSGTVTRCRLCVRSRARENKRKARDQQGLCRNHLHPVSPNNGLYTVTSDGRRSYHCLLCMTGKTGRYRRKKLQGQLTLPL